MSKTKEIRRQNLQLLIDEYGLTNLARLAEANRSYLSQISNRIPRVQDGKPSEVGDQLARRMEKKLHLGNKWMDQSHDELPDMVDDAALQLLHIFVPLNPEQRQIVLESTRLLIQSMVNR
ncbi:MAG: hypothetical protein OEX19_15325 [Gammaproteobacteria bacterium]|nr:hypothetical protein [Gammaproteobacteria bacterium]